MSRRNTSTQLLIFGAICLVAVNAWMAYLSLQVLEQAQHWVRHTYQVIAQVEFILGSVEDAEIAQRDFLITGNQRFLQSYRAVAAALPQPLDQFQQLTADRSIQQQRLQQMRSSVQRRLQILDRGVALRASGGGVTAAGLVVVDEGAAEMDHLRLLGRQMIDDEQGLLVVRQETAHRAGVRARWTIGLASVLDAFLLFVTMRFLVRERQQRLLSELSAVRLAEARTDAETRADEVRALNATLEERVRHRTAELETINRELEAFSYSVSHDLRAPLRTVDGFSLALEEDYAAAIDETGRDYIRRVRNGVQRMGQLIDALLQLSRITRAELNREDFDLSALAESVAEAVWQQEPQRQIVFRIQPGLRASGDPRLIGVALENLLGNAAKFTSKTPEPLVEFGWDPQQNAYFVRDNGAGFDMAYVGKLFNAFNRLHGDKDFKGSGIGLATVARVVRRHHGAIWARGEVGHGATFWFTLG